MIRTIYGYISIGFSLILSSIPLLYILLFRRFMSEKTKNNIVYHVSTLWGKWMVSLSSSKITVVDQNKLPKENALFVSNHQSYYDIPLLLANIKRPIAFVAKIEMKKAPVMSTWMDVMGCLFLDRSNTRQSLKTILEGVNRLKCGHNLVIFPEGTRSIDGKISPFKQGSLKLGTKAGVPIVPITIVGSGNMYEYAGKRFSKHDGVQIRIHDAIYPDKLNPDEEKNLAAIVQKIIQKPLEENKVAE